MSMWTHIVAAIDCETYIHSNVIKADVEKLLEDAPTITGSEGSADVFVNVLSGHNIWTNCDCKHCKYQDTIQHDKENGGFCCGCPDGYECPEGEYQTRVVITVVGDLRDRMRNTTEAEWQEFKTYIEKHINGRGFSIRNCAYSITGW